VFITWTWQLGVGQLNPSGPLAIMSCSMQTLQVWRWKHGNNIIFLGWSAQIINHQIFTVGCIRVGLKPLFFDETKDRLVSVKKTNLVRRFDYVRVRQNISSEKAVNGISFWLFRKHSSWEMDRETEWQSDIATEHIFMNLLDFNTQLWENCLT
jgi:hypothetical protein